MTTDYFEPESISEVVSLLDRFGDNGCVIAGGQSLLVMMRHGLVSPRYLVSLKNVVGLSGIQESTDGDLTIGAMTSHRDVHRSSLLQRRTPVLCQAAAKVGSTPIRNLGTIAGNICHNELGADPPAALLVLDSRAVCVSANGERNVPLAQFFTGYFETALRPGEVVKAIEIPSPPSDMAGIYLKYVVRSGDLAVVGVAVLLGLESDGKHCREVRIGLGGVAPVPLRAHKAEQILRGNAIGDEILSEVANVARSEVDPVSDAHGSAEYRRKMVAVFVKRAIRHAVDVSLGQGAIYGKTN